MARLNNYNIVKAAVWYTIGNILIRGVAFFALPLFTALMSTHDYGIYTVYSSYLSLFETFILFGLSSTVSLARFTEHMDFDAYMSTILTVPPALTTVAGCGINLYLCVAGSLLGMDAVLWNSLLVSAAAASIAGIIQAKLILEGRYKLYLAFSALNLLGNIGLSLLLRFTVFHMRNIYLSRVIGSCAANIVGAIFLLLCTHFKKRVRLSYYCQAFSWGTPLLFHTFATVVLTQTDRILIDALNDHSSAGIYGVAVTVTMIPLTLQTSLHSAWQPWFYDELEQKRYSAIRSVNHEYIMIFSVITAEFCLITPEIIHIFTNEAYWDCIYSLVPLSISVFGEMLYSIPVSLEYFHKKTTYIMAGTLACTVCNIALDVVFIQNFGYIAAAYATMLSKLLLFLFHYLLSTRIDAAPLFRKRYVLISMVFLGAVDLITVTGVANVLLRLFLFLIIGLLFLWFIWKDRKKLAMLLHQNT